MEKIVFAYLIWFIVTTLGVTIKSKNWKEILFSSFISFLLFTLFMYLVDYNFYKPLFK